MSCRDGLCRRPWPWSPSPGLAPAVAANTAVFVLGIKVLLKGLTWPGVINSWFLGTVRCYTAAVGSETKMQQRSPTSTILLHENIHFHHILSLSFASERDPRGGGRGGIIRFGFKSRLSESDEKQNKNRYF